MMIGIQIYQNFREDDLDEPDDKPDPEKNKK
jgi:hypothetical protein